MKAFQHVDDYNRLVILHQPAEFPDLELADALLALGETKNTKIFSAAISILQKSISGRHFPRSLMEKLVDFLKVVKSTNDDILRIKIIQLLIPMSDARLLDYGNLSIIHNVLLPSHSESTYFSLKSLWKW